VGLALAKDGHVMPPEEFHKLPTKEKERLQAEMAQIQAQLEATFREVPQWESERHQKIRELNRIVVRFAVGHLIAGLKQRFAQLANIVSYLEIVEHDLVENAGQFLFRARIEAAEAPAEIAATGMRPDPEFFNRYRINLFVDHAAAHGAPIVDEDHPTLPNLIGRVEYRPRFGALVTDFTLIRPGALHQANGGYLVLDARRVLLQPFAWEGLKRVLRAREIRIQSVGEMAGLISAETLQPEPIPLDIKVLLTGERTLYYLLHALDPDFRELFKVAADFDDEIARSDDAELGLARLIAMFVRSNGLKPLDRAAVAAVVEQTARMAGDSAKLSAELEVIADLVREADFLASERAADVVGKIDVEAAIAAKIRRASRVRERLLEEIARGTLLIETSGIRVGQVNGLSVLSAGGFAFGHPSRITARVRVGKGEVIDIQREVELGGPIHSKGVLILAGYMSERFGRRRPLALAASIVFEQTYGPVEGDSASLAELCALLSALAGAGLRQGLAVTGSVNQHGEVQPIGGLNEKVEGFFDVCSAQGLTGEQGVIVPTANVKHLMLRQDVVDAANAGRFHLFAVKNVDEALVLLTGLPAGERDASGAFPAGTVNCRADAELLAMAEAARQFLPRIESARAPP
jgi:predicted ATP-dependent protease